MALVSSFLVQPRTALRRASSPCNLAPVALGLILQLISATAFAANETRAPAGNGVWIIGTIALLLLIAMLLVSRARINAARREAARARELAEHREYERNAAQKELVRRLEEERELAKEKMQFESQLSEFEKYASLAQLALGAAHEINNPLLGILSHLELEWKDAGEERRVEIEQCIEGAKRISSAVRGLLDYARPGPLRLSKVNLHRLGTETLKFVEHQPMFRRITLQNCIPVDLPYISADANQLSQILMNLLLNAAEATPPGGTKPIQVDVRIITATNKVLKEAVTKGEFREDLYYRLNVLPLFIPPLRERREDILPLALDIMQHFNKELKKNFGGFTPAAAELLQRYPWPGNIRELRNVIERTMILSKETEVDEEALPEEIRDYHQEAAPPEVMSSYDVSPTGDQFVSLRELEDRYIAEC